MIGTVGLQALGVTSVTVQDCSPSSIDMLLRSLAPTAPYSAEGSS